MKDKLKGLFDNKKVLILGMGREGVSTEKFLKKFFPELKFSTADKKQGGDYLDNLQDFDLIIKSPGISWNIEKIKKAQGAGIEFTSQTQIFLDLFRDQTIGVTGTKGKSTTASLIYNILKLAGKNVKLVGNIGEPVLDYIGDADGDCQFVFEMSSHQLSDITTSPHIAVFLNIYPEHLDYYSNFEEYFVAKTNIAKYQSAGDVFVFDSDFGEISDFAKTIRSLTVPFSSEDALESFGIKLDSNPLLGVHNMNNIKAAILVARNLGIENNVIKKGVETFEPLADRLEVVRKIEGVTFVNDGLATIPQATISAVESFKNDRLTLILGGFDRGIDFDVLGKYLSKASNVKNVILIGQTAEKINKSLLENNYQGKIFNLGKVSMKEIVGQSYEAAKPDGTVLLSPSATSFDMFKDYRDRDGQFKLAVNDWK
jgi:UDP-N-acetylmuramoylalanine--D-glutamate ligase